MNSRPILLIFSLRCREKLVRSDGAIFVVFPTSDFLVSSKNHYFIAILILLYKKLQNLTFLHEFSTDFDNFWTEITRKISPSWWCIFCGFSHVRFSGILKKPVFYTCGDPKVSDSYTDYPFKGSDSVYVQSCISWVSGIHTDVMQ